LQCQFAVGSCVDRVATLSQTTLEHGAQSFIVFCDEHSHHPCLAVEDDVNMKHSIAVASGNFPVTVMLT
jgi:hypothetical protein